MSHSEHSIGVTVGVMASEREDGRRQIGNQVSGSVDRQSLSSCVLLLLLEDAATDANNFHLQQQKKMEPRLSDR